MLGGDSSYLWLAVLFLYVTPVFMVAQFSVFYSFIYIFGFLVSKPWLLWTVTKQTVTNWRLPVISPSGVWYYTVTGWVFSNIWKEHKKPCTQIHSITSQHTKILHPLPFWALYCYFWHNHFLSSYIPSIWKKGMMKTNSNIIHFGLFVVNDVISLICIFLQKLNLRHWNCVG